MPYIDGTQVDENGRRVGRVRLDTEIIVAVTRIPGRALGCIIWMWGDRDPFRVREDYAEIVRQIPPFEGLDE